MLSVLALAAAGCSAHGGSTNGTGPPVGAAELPPVKAGYWERTVNVNGAQQVTHVCHSGEPLKLDGVDRNCSAFVVSRAMNGAIQVDATCASGPVSSTLHESFSGDFQASYASDTQLTLTLKGQAPRTLTTHVAMRYVGACPPAPPPGGPSDAG